MIKLIMLFVFNLLYIIEGLMVNDNDLRPRIINGDKANPADFPFAVMLIDGDYFATGVILNNDWVLTVASGLEGRMAPQIEIIAGSNNLRKSIKIHKVEKVIIHEKFVGHLTTNDDIALLNVATCFEFSNTIQPITLPEFHSKVATNAAALVSGWGTINDSLPVPSHTLQVALVYIVDQEYCSKLIKEQHMTVYNSNICANDPNIVKGPCYGDSGALLIIESKLIGLASWSIRDPGCGSTKYPAIYTRVSEYIDWILKNSK